MIVLIKEFLISVILFGLIKILMIFCRPVEEFISSLTLNIGKGVLYISTAVIILPRKVSRRSSKNSGEDVGQEIINFFKNIACKVVKIAGKVYMINKVDYNICPQCFTRYHEPRYVCPKCGNIYHSLEPSVNGILNIECSCGCKIPVTAFGKRKLKTLCPTCGSESSFPEIPSFVIAVVGGEGSGKSTFLENSGLKRVVGAEEIFYEAVIENEKKRKMQIMVVETKGSDFSSSEALKKHKYYEYNSGFIFLIDPFAMQGLNTLNKSNYLLSDVLDTIILNLQKNYDLSPGEMIEKPVAFVLAKSDMLLHIDIKSGIKDFLINNNEEVFLNKIHSNFTNYKFFEATINTKNNKEIINWIIRNM